MSTTLLPSNATQAEKAFDYTFAKHLDNVQVSRIYTQWDPYKCPVELLSWLAWAVSVDDWNSDWPEQVKRDVIAKSIEVHRTKGTRYSVKTALEAFGYESQIVEWHEQENTAPKSFSINVEVDDRGIDALTINEIQSSIDNTKMQSSFYKTVLKLASAGDLKVAARTEAARCTYINAWQPSELVKTLSNKVASASSSVMSASINYYSPPELVKTLNSKVASASSSVKSTLIEFNDVEREHSSRFFYALATQSQKNTLINFR